MSSETRFKSFDPSQRTTLQHAFNAAWVELKRKGVVTDTAQEKETKLMLAGCIVTLANEGVTDLDELTKRALELMLIGPT